MHRGSLLRGRGRSTLVQPRNTGNRHDMTGKLLTWTYIASTQKARKRKFIFALQRKVSPMMKILSGPGLTFLLFLKDFG